MRHVSPPCYDKWAINVLVKHGHATSLNTTDCKSMANAIISLDYTMHVNTVPDFSNTAYLSYIL